jgi:hypothetical protein
VIVDSELIAEVRDELHPGERVLWAGRARPLRFVLRDSYRLLAGLGSLAVLALMIFIFSQFFGGFGFRSVNGGFSFSSFFSLFWLIAVIAVLASAAPIVADYLRARRMVYAVTDRRLLIVTLPALWWGRSVQSFGAGDIRGLTRRMHGDSTGDVIFSSETYSVRRRYGYSTRTRDVGFFGIPDAREVEELISRTFRPDVY